MSLVDTKTNQCWAKPFSECNGQLTKEHLISSCMLSKTIDVRGYKWCHSEFKSVGKQNLVAHVLCEGHNSALSRLDEEAKKVRHELTHFLAAVGELQAYSQPSKSGSRNSAKRLNSLIHNVGYREVNAWMWARCMCKYYVNSKAASRLPFDDDFAKYALGLETLNQLHFYTSAYIGKSFLAKPKELMLHDYYSGQGDVVYYINFYGFDLIATNFELSSGLVSLPALGIQLDSSRLMNRLSEMVVPSPSKVEAKLGKNVGKFTFRWDEEPIWN